MPVILPATEDNAQSTLSGGITAASSTIPVADGSVYPQPYRGTASSTGSSTTLNDTGDLGNVAAGDIVRNVTDGSWAICTATGTNSITTTRLQGGSDNTWQSGDEWRVNEFLLTLDDGDANGENVTKREKVLIYDRSGNNLSVPSGGRGYDGSTAQSFDSGDYVRLSVTSLTVENLIDAIADTAEWANTNQTNIESNDTDIANQQTGSYHYVAATGSSNAYVAATPALSAYAAGNIVRFKANHTNSGAATLNVNSLGAKTIKKRDGATDVASGDIQSGQIVEVVYDGTNFQMVTPIGQSTQQDLDVVNSNLTDSSEGGASSTSEVNLDENYAIPASAWAAGVAFRVTSVVHAVMNNSDNVTVRLKIGTTTLLSQQYTNVSANVRGVPVVIEAYIVCLSVSASGTYTFWGTFMAPEGYSETVTAANSVVLSGKFPAITDASPATETNTLDMTTSQTLQISVQYGGSSANNKAVVQRLIVERLAAN